MNLPLFSPVVAVVLCSLTPGVLDAQGILYWDSNGNSPGLGGSGAWSGLYWSNFSSGTATTRAWSTGSTAVFAETPGTVTVDASITVKGMNFNSNGYLIRGSLPVNLSSTASLDSAASSSATLLVPLAGSGSLNKTGSGEIILTAANTYTGKTSVSAGRLQLGNGDTNAATNLQFAAGYAHNLVLRDDGSLWAMGDNSFGQLGLGDNLRRNVATKVIGSGIRAVAATYHQSLILKTDGSLHAAGYNGYGQLGLGSTSNSNSFALVLSSGVSAMATGYHHSLILKTDGSLWAMGRNNYGQLGLGDTNDRSTPTMVLDGGVIAIGTGSHHSLFIKSDGSLWVMGWNNYGQLGTGDSNDRSSPTRILAAGVVAVAAGMGHTLILNSNGSVYGMGFNIYGELGLGDYHARVQPEQIVSQGARAIAAGDYHSLILNEDGSVDAMGLNSYGQLGLGDADQRNTKVRALQGNVSAIAGGFTHSLFLRTDSSIWASGNNDYGQFGLGDNSSRSSPTALPLTYGVGATGTLGNTEVSVESGATIAFRPGAVASGTDLGSSLTLKPGGTLSIAVALNSNAQDPINIGGTLTLNAGHAINLHAPALPKPGRYVLLTAASILGQLAAPTLSGDWRNVRLHLTAANGSLILSVAQTDPLEAGIGEPFSLTLDSGTWYLSSGTPPSGLSISSNAGVPTFSGRPSGNAGSYDFTLSSSSGSGKINVYNLSLRPSLYWDASGSTPGLGGSGLWSASLWAASDGGNSTTGNWLNNAWANFNGVGGDIAVDANFQASVLNFNDAGFALNGVSPLSLAWPARIRCAGNTSTLVAASLRGVSGLQKTGIGELVFTGSQDYSGDTQISAGCIQLGNGRCNSTPNAAIASGANHLLILKRDGSLWACGDNASGQLGLGDNTSRSLPSLVLASGVSSVAAGTTNSFIIKTDGSLWATGANWAGQLGLGDTSSRNRLTRVLDSGVKAVASGFAHTLILKNDGSVWAVGLNEYGQLGLGDTSSRNRPVQVMDSGVSTVSAGYSHSLILKNDGSLWAMGANNWGQSGFSDPNARLVATSLFSSGISAIAAGFYHSLIVKGDGSLHSTGYNLFGQLGLGDLNNRSAFTKAVNGGVRAVSTGLNHSLFLKSDGSLWAMGSNRHGQLGVISVNNTFTQVLSSDVDAIVASNNHSLFLKSNGSLWVMGFNGYGQLGVGDKSNRILPTATSPAFKIGSTATLGKTPVSVQAGARLAFRPGEEAAPIDIDSSLAIGSSAVLELAVAANIGDQDPLNLGGGLLLNEGHRLELRAATAPAPGSYTLIAATSISGTPSAPALVGDWQGRSGTLSVTGNRLVLTIDAPTSLLTAFPGLEYFQQLPSGEWSLLSGSELPMGLRLAQDAAGGFFIYGRPTAVVQEYLFTLVRTLSGTSNNVLFSILVAPANYYWDVNAAAAGLGGSGNWSSSLWSNSGLGVADNCAWVPGAQAIFAGNAGWVTLGANTSASAIYFRSNGYSIAGNATLSLSGAALIEISNAVSATLFTPVGGRSGLNKDGTGSLVLSSRSSYSGNTEVRAGRLQLGNGDINSAATTTISAGGDHNLILKSDGSLWVMGRGYSGQLGLGDTNDRTSPTGLLGSDVRAVASGAYHSLFLKTDGSLWSMGYNRFGQLGVGDTKDRNFPVQVISSGVRAIAAGWAHSLFVKTDGSLWVMGQGYLGQLGLGGVLVQDKPAMVMSGGVTAVAAGDYHSLVLKDDGSLWVMGFNSNGQLGLPNISVQTTPATVFSEGISAISAGGFHSLVLKTDGSVWATGLNNSGQLGLGDNSDRDRFTASLISDVRELDGGSYHSLFLKNDGSLYGTGSNGAGQLGLGDRLSQNTPARILDADISAVAGGINHSLILKTDGSLLAMGLNQYGQLGLGDKNPRRLPAALTIAFGSGSTATLGSTPVTVLNGASLIHRPGPVPAATDIDSSVTLNSNAQLDLNVAAIAENQDPLNLSGPLTLQSNHLIHLHANVLPKPGVYTLLTAASIQGTPTIPSLSGRWPETTINLSVSGNSLQLFVSKLAQSIVFEPIGDQLATATVRLAATATSGLPVTFNLSADSKAIASISANGMLSFTNEGSVEVTAVQEGNANHLAATAVTQRIAVTRANATITLSDLNPLFDGSPKPVSAATEPSGLPVRLTYTGSGSTSYPSSTTAPSDAGTYLVSATMTDTRYNGSATATLNILMISQFWDRNGPESGLGGSGLWSGPHWAESDAGTVNTSGWLDRSIAVFSGAAGDVSLYTPMNASGLSFLTDGYGLFGPSLLNLSGSATVNSSHAVNARIAAKLVGQAGLHKTGSGSLQLLNANLYGGNTNISAGRIQLGNGDSPSLIFSGSILEFVVRADGSLWAMGGNSSGQLGLGDTTNRNAPTQVLPAPLPGQPTIKTLAGGTQHSVLVKSDGSLWATGLNDFGALGLGDTNGRRVFTEVLAAPAVGQPGVQAVAAGAYHTLILKTDGSLWATGGNWAGQLGLGSDFSNRTRPEQVLPPTEPGKAGVCAIAAGAYHSLILKTDGSLWAMGSNSQGESGLGNTYSATTPTLVLSSGVRAISSSWLFSLILKTNGSLWAMGENDFGQLGVGDNTQRKVPTEVVREGVTAIAAGWYHSLFLTADGRLWGMGENGLGALGLGDTIHRRVPTLLHNNGTPIRSPRAFSAGSTISLILKSDGSLWHMGQHRGSVPVAFGTDFYTGSVGTLGSSPVTVQSGAALAFRPGAGAVAVDIDSSLTVNANATLDLAVSGSDDAQDPLDLSAGLILSEGNLINLHATTPPVAGTYTLLRASRISGNPAMPSLSGFWNHVSLSLVTSGNSLALSVTDLGPLEAVTGEAFSLTLGNGLWSLNDGNLPSGLSLESSNGLTTISGTPNGAPGTYVFSVIHPAANGSSTVINHRLNLRLGQYWDTNGTVAGLGGSGSWAANHWSATQLGTSSTAAWIQGALANFGGSPGTVTLNASVDVSGLRFFGDRFTVSGASPLNLVSPASILSAQGVRAEVATPISGNAGINKTGPGTVTLSAANTYDGNTKINAGTLQLGSGSWNIAIASGDRHALFLKSDGTVWATGANNSGQLGLGDKDDRSVPTQIAISGVKAIACGYYHSLLLKNDGSLWAMGANSNSQLGLSGREPYVTPEQVLPATRAGEAEITAIAGGTEHSLILRSDGSVWTINGDLILSRDAKAIAAGRGNNFILKTDGTVWAQGNNLPGLFGLGDNYRRDSLTQVASEVSAIAVGDGSCFLVKSDGSLWGAGLNDFGHLGLGDTTNRNRFCQVVSAGVRAVATCRAQTFFIKTDGSLWGMGWGPTLGLNTFENCTLPIQVLSSGVRDAAPQLFDGLILTADGTILKIAFLAAPTPLTDFGAGSTGTLGNTPVTVQGEAVLAFRPGPTPAATDIGSSVTCNSGGTLDLYVAPTAATQDALNLSGALNLSSGHLINLYAPSLPSPGSYTLVRASSITGTPAVPSFSGSWLNSSARLGVFGNSLVLTVIKAAQSLSFASIADQAQNSTLVLSASASSGLAVVFSTTSPIASLNGNTLSFTGTGSVTIVASQAGDEFYEAAPTVSQTFHVSDPLQLQAAAAAMTSSALSAPDQSAEVDAAEAAALPASSALTEAVAGNFEALLRRPASDPEAPNEIIGLLSLSSTGNSASARLLLANQEQPLRLAAGLVEQSGEVMMQANDGALSYRLGLAGNADSTLEVTLQRDGELIAVASDSRRLHEGSVPVSLRGRYELRLQAQSPRDGQPSEAGLAQAMLQDSGRLDLAGRLGDGTTVTSSLNLDAALGCRWMILPYQRANAWLGGQWLLRAPADGGLNWSSQSDDLLWTKDANPKDASFPEGFGPIPMRLQMQR